jgi:hypothetical protein
MSEPSWSLNVAQPTVPTSSNAVANAEQGMHLALIRELPEECDDGKPLLLDCSHLNLNRDGWEV